MNGTCERCGGPMAALFTSLYCSLECDKRPAMPRVDARYSAWRRFGDLHVPGRFTPARCDFAYDLKWEIGLAIGRVTSEWDGAGQLPDLTYGASSINEDGMARIVPWLQTGAASGHTRHDAAQIASNWRGTLRYAHAYLLAMAWRIS